MDKNLKEDLKFMKQTEVVWECYEYSEFKTSAIKGFLKDLEKL